MKERHNSLEQLNLIPLHDTTMIPNYMLRQIAEDETLPEATRRAAADSIRINTVSFFNYYYHYLSHI